MSSSVIKPQRNSAVELLRIVAMFFIVMSHCSYHSPFPLAGSEIFFNDLLLDWATLGHLGVDIFVIITGYFSYRSKYNIKSLIKNLNSVWFYSIASFSVAAFLNYEFTAKEIISSFMPTIFSSYWFFTTYFVFIIFSPYINIFIDNITRKQHLSCIGTMLFLWSFILIFTNISPGCSPLAEFVLYYLIGAYLGKYPDNVFKNYRFRVLCTLISFFLLFLSSVAIDIAASFIPFLFGRGIIFYDRLSILIIGCAVGLFTLAIYSKPFHNPFINRVALCTFGVYLSHNNKFILKFLWQDWLNISSFYNSPMLLPVFMATAVLVFIVCLLIEFIRQKTIEKPMFNATYFVYLKIESLAHKIFTKVVPYIESIKY